MSSSLWRAGSFGKWSWRLFTTPFARAQDHRFGDPELCGDAADLVVGQVPVHDHDRVVQVPPLDQPGAVEHLHLVQEAERAAGGELGDELLLQVEQPGVLAAEGGVVVVHHDGDPVVVGGKGDDVDPLLLVLVVDRLVDDQVVLRSVLLLESGLQQRLHVRLGAPVQHRRLVVVEVDDDVVDLQSHQRGEHVLDGVDAGVADGDRGPPGDVDDVVDVRGDLRRPAEIHPAEPDPVVLRRRPEGHGRDVPRVQADAATGKRVLDGALLDEHGQGWFT